VGPAGQLSIRYKSLICPNYKKVVDYGSQNIKWYQLVHLWIKVVVLRYSFDNDVGTCMYGFVHTLKMIFAG
jgi:hypothetical protein